MAIDPVGITAIRVGQLPEAPITLSSKIAHEVGTDLKRGTVLELSNLIASQIESSGGVGYLPISVVDGQQLPDVPTDASFFLCGKGTFLNVNGYPDIVCVEELNAIMSVTDHWEIAVEIPIEVNPELLGIAQTVNLGVLDSAPSQDAVYKAINQYVNAVGSFHYADLATQTTPQAIAANVDEKLLNDALGAYTNVSNAPYGVSSTYNSTTNQLDFSELSIGDLINFRIDLFIETSGIDQLFRFYIKFGIGSPSEFTLNVAQGQVKTNSMFRVSEDVCFDIGSADIRDYPAEIWIATDKTADITINGWYLEVVRKNINIVDFTDANAVHKTGNETIAGVKTFVDGIIVADSVLTDQAVVIDNGILKISSGAIEDQASILADNITADRSFQLPDKSGTFALLDDITGGSETTTTMGSLINSAGNATPNNTDFIATAESAGLLKKISWTNAKAFLKTYFDGIYEKLTNKQNSLAVDGTGVKYPTVDAVNALKWIKSNESLSLAQRKGDVLYGILDQYTGEEMTLSKVTGTPTVDGVIYFQLGAEYFKRNFTEVNVKWFGAKGDNTNDDTVAIQAAIDYCGTFEGICFVPNGTYKITNGLVIDTGILFTGENLTSTIINIVSATRKVAVKVDSQGINGYIRGGGIQKITINCGGTCDGVLIDVVAPYSINQAVYKDIKITNTVLGFETKVDDNSPLIYINIFENIAIEQGIKEGGFKLYGGTYNIYSQLSASDGSVTDDYYGFKVSQVGSTFTNITTDSWSEFDNIYGIVTNYVCETTTARNALSLRTSALNIYEGLYNLLFFANLDKSRYESVIQLQDRNVNISDIEINNLTSDIQDYPFNLSVSGGAGVIENVRTINPFTYKIEQYVSAANLKKYNFINCKEITDISNITEIKLTSLPTATEKLRFTKVILEGGLGVKDEIYQCRKNKLNTYEWVKLLTVENLTNNTFVNIDANTINGEGKFSAFPILASSTNIFPTINNANAILHVDMYEGTSEFAQIGFNAAGELYHRYSTGTWSKIVKENSSPIFTGIPAAPTATAGTNTTQLATTAFVQTAVGSNVTDAIVDGVTTVAPSQNAVFDALAGKASLSGANFTGQVNANNFNPGLGNYMLNTGDTGLVDGVSGGSFTMRYPTPGWISTQVIESTSFIATNGTIRLKNYTVATLPTGVRGDTAYVTDALAPTYMTTVVGGGAIVCPVFYNGTAWVAH